MAGAGVRHSKASAALLKGLSKEQRAAVCSPVDKSVVISAGAGSGKTTVLTARLVHLLSDRDVPPKQIVCTTFTTRAARELRARVEGLLSRRSDGLRIGTLHSIAHHLLKVHGHSQLKISPDYAVIGQDIQTQILREYCPAGKGLTAKQIRVLVMTFSQLKSLLPEEKCREKLSREGMEQMQQLWREYHDFCRSENLFDFDDLIIWGGKIVPDPCAHLLIDEFQDLNHAQTTLCRSIMGKQGNFYAVGDEDQQIYTFRGADFSPEKISEGRAVIRHKMETNYRSTKPILDLGNAVIADNTYREEKVLRPADKFGKTPVCLYICVDELHEREFVSQSLQRLREKKQLPYGEMAVITRTKDMLRQLQGVLLVSGVPFQLMSSDDLTSNEKFQATFAFFRLCLNLQSSAVLWKMVLLRIPGIGEKTAGKLCAEKDIFAAAKKSKKARNLANLLSDISALVHHETSGVDEFLDVLKIAFESILGEGMQRADVQAMLDAAEIYSRRNPQLGAVNLLTDFVDRVSVESVSEEADDRVHLLTVHAAKGSEFEAVYIMGADDGMFPSYRSDNMEEERRLLFVAITRAKRYLAMTSARRRYIRAQNKIVVSQTSRFLRSAQSEKLFKRHVVKGSRSKATASCEEEQASAG